MNTRIASGGLIFDGGFFCVIGLGGLYLEGLIVGILRYFVQTIQFIV